MAIFPHGIDGTAVDMENIRASITIANSKQLMQFTIYLLCAEI